MYASLIVGIISALIAGGTAIAGGVSNKKARDEASGLAAEQQQQEDLSTARGREIAEQKAQNDALQLENDKKQHTENMLKANDELHASKVASYKASMEALPGNNNKDNMSSYDNNISLNRSIRNLMR